MDGCRHEGEFIKNSRGMKLYTSRWLPARDRAIKALVFLCHGYGVECSVFMRDTGIRLARAGYAVFGMDFEGHGKSQGTRCYIEKFSTLVDDLVDYSRTIRELPEYKSKARFLYGESMGGAIALLVHRKEPCEWNGAVLVAPMCKISEKLKPNPLVVSLLIQLSPLIKTWKIVPTNSIIDTAFKDPVKREEIRNNPYIYKDKPRVKTAIEMLRASTDLEQRLDEVTFPFMVVHGEDDIVTDPQCSRELYTSSASTDKTLKIYEDMWHGLTVGESDEHISQVFGDIVSWLDKRSSAGALLVRSTPVAHAAALPQAAVVAAVPHDAAHNLHYADFERIVVENKPVVSMLDNRGSGKGENPQTHCCEELQQQKLAAVC